MLSFQWLIFYSKLSVKHINVQIRRCMKSYTVSSSHESIDENSSFSVTHHSRRKFTFQCHKTETFSLLSLRYHRGWPLLLLLTVEYLYVMIINGSNLRYLMKYYAFTIAINKCCEFYDVQIFSMFWYVWLQKNMIQNYK